jgi:hypothetical protein
MDFTNVNAGTVLSLIFGPGGVLLVGIYIFWLGMKGSWMFAAVHDKIVAQYESRLQEANKRVIDADTRTDAANIRAEKWQQLYLESKRIVDASTTLAAGVVAQSQTPQAGG